MLQYLFLFIFLPISKPEISYDLRLTKCTVLEFHALQDDISFAS